jgi:hypothetical protein
VGEQSEEINEGKINYSVEYNEQAIKTFNIKKGMTIAFYLFFRIYFNSTFYFIFFLN